MFSDHLFHAEEFNDDVILPGTRGLQFDIRDISICSKRFKNRSVKITVVVIPPNVKHWHGAKMDSWFSHISLEVPGENTSNEWLNPVSDDEYNALQ